LVRRKRCHSRSASSAIQAPSAPSLRAASGQNPHRTDQARLGHHHQRRHGARREQQFQQFHAHALARQLR
jgi:hypothetical protein